MNALLLFGLFFVLLFLNVPIAISLGVSSVVTTMAVKPAMMATIATNLYSATNTYVLLAIPFFILAGNIMDVSGISVRLINFFNSLVGHTKHGTAMVCVIVACFFAAISGSGPATVAALGGILIPAMSRSGYEKSTSAALMSTAGAIGIVIPPSITFCCLRLCHGHVCRVALHVRHRSRHPHRHCHLLHHGHHLQGARACPPAEGQRRAALEGVQGRRLGHPHAGHHPRRYLRRHLSPRPRLRRSRRSTASSWVSLSTARSSSRISSPSCASQSPRPRSSC